MLIPTISFVDADAKMRVPHPKSRVSSLNGVVRRPSPILGKEKGKPIAGWLEVIGVQRPEYFVGGDSLIEAGS